MYAEEDYLMLSGIQHFAFCRRQWAIIHIEQQWEDNYRTTSGELMHKKAHDEKVFEKRGDLLTVRGLRISSREADSAMLWNFGSARAVLPCLDMKGNGVLFRLNLNMEHRRSTMRTSCSFARRRSVWRRCSRQIFRTDIYITARTGGVPEWSLPCSFGTK